jgi:hypothetical protein
MRRTRAARSESRLAFDNELDSCPRLHYVNAHAPKGTRSDSTGHVKYRQQQVVRKEVRAVQTHCLVSGRQQQLVGLDCIGVTPMVRGGHSSQLTRHLPRWLQGARPKWSHMRCTGKVRHLRT